MCTRGVGRTLLRRRHHCTQLHHSTIRLRLQAPLAHHQPQQAPAGSAVLAGWASRWWSRSWPGGCQARRPLRPAALPPQRPMPQPAPPCVGWVVVVRVAVVARGAVPHAGRTAGRASCVVQACSMCSMVMKVTRACTAETGADSDVLQARTEGLLTTSHGAGHHGTCGAAAGEPTVAQGPKGLDGDRAHVCDCVCMRINSGGGLCVGQGWVGG